MKPPNDPMRLQQPEPTQHGERCGCNDCFAKQVTAIAECESARLEAEKNAEAGIVRLREYLDGAVPGYSKPLLDTPNNRAKFNAFVKERSDIPLGSILVDSAIAALQLQLDWEQPITLKDGRPQRRLDETPNHTWSVEQLRDWSKRSDAQKLFRNQQYGGNGSIRTNWFKADSQVR